MSVVQVRHVGIVVNDMERSLSFWRDALGLTVQVDVRESGPFIEQALGIPAVEVRTVKLSALRGPTLVELLRFSGGPYDRPRLDDLRRLGPTHVALTVDDLRELHGRLVAAGTRFVAEPRASADGGALVAFCSDPDGTMIELVEHRA